MEDIDAKGTARCADCPLARYALGLPEDSTRETDKPAVRPRRTSAEQEPAPGTTLF